MIRTVAAWVMRDNVPRVSRAVAPAWILLAFAVVQIDVVIDWEATRATIAATPWLSRVGVAGMVAAVWAMSIAEPLRLGLRADQDRWRWRLPLAGVPLALALAPVWILSVLPLFFLGWLCQLPIALPAAAIYPGLALASGRRARAAVGAVAGLALLTAAQALPIGIIALFVAGVLGCAELAKSPPPAGISAKPGRWAAIGPASALCLRDLRALWRLERGVVLGALFASAPAYAVQSAAVANFPLQGEGAVRGGLLVLTLASTATAGAILTLPTVLGAGLDPRRAPISTPQRAGLFTVVGATLLVPTLVAIWTAGSGGGLRLLLHSAAMLSGAGWFAVGIGRRTDTDRSSFIWWVIVLGGLALTPLPWGALSSGVLTLLAWFGTARTLAKARRLP